MKCKTLIISLIIVFLSGCAAHEPENRAFIILLGIEKDNGYNVVANVAKLGDDKPDSFITYSAESDNIYDALKKINAETSGDLYMGHIQAVIINENMQNEIRSLVNNNINIGRDIPIIKSDDVEGVMTFENEKISLTDYIVQYFKNYDSKKANLTDYINSDDIDIPSIKISKNNYLLE